MELVTLVEVVFNRLGTASGGSGFSSQRQLQKTGQIADEQPETISEFITATAEANGERVGSLSDLRWQRAYGGSRGEYVFDIQRSNIQYGSPYAICKAFPALKVGERFFRLDEVNV
jgi:hypothetical protein